MWSRSKISPRTPSIAALALTLAQAGLDGTAWAQIPSVCSNTPDTNERVECREPAGSSEALGIDLRAVSIKTDLNEERAVFGMHQGSGDIGINFRDGLIGTEGRNAPGIIGWHNGNTGNTRITVQRSPITTAGWHSHGVYGAQYAAGDLGIHVEGGSVTTKGGSASGIIGLHGGASGDLAITMRDSSIKTTGRQAHGIDGWSGWRAGATGNVGIAMRGGSISTEGQNSHGIFGVQYAAGDLGIHAGGGSVATAGEQAHGIVGWHNGNTGNTRITVQGGSIATAGRRSHGLYGLQFSKAEGNLDIHVEGGSITTSGEQAHGIYGRYRGVSGNLGITIQGGSITTTGRQAHGISGRHGGASGDLAITMQGGLITTAGEQAHGIRGEQHGSGEIHINVQGGTILASGPDASGIRVGGLDESGVFQGAAGVGSDGYRRQTVTVDGRVRGGAGAGAGVSLLGGGKVVIGPQGHLSADSGVAVRSSGGHLRMDIWLNGRLMEEAMDGEVLNDGGRIDLTVSGMLLHDGATCAAGCWGANGVWDVLARAEAETTSRRGGPVKIEFVEAYAPRTVLYESLPGLLLRLDEGPPRRRPETLAWTQIEHAVGHGEPARSQTGARYDYDRTEIVAGMSRAWDRGVSGSLWLRGARVAAETEVLSGRSELDVQGVGVGLDVRWRGPDGLELSGQLSLTDYDVDASSRRHGRLLREVGAQVLSARLAAGRRMALGPGATLLPRAWLRYAEMKVDDFTDAVGLQASYADESRSTGGLGLVAEWADSGRSLYGSIDLERLLGGEATAVEMSGRRFGAATERTRSWLGFGGESRERRLTLRGGVRLADPGGRNEEFAASFSLAGHF